MSDYVPVTPGSGANVGAVPLTMPDTTTAYVSAGILGTNNAGTWTPIATGNPLAVTVENSSIAVTASALPLPSGAATAALQTTGNTSLASILSALGGSIAVTGTFWQTTQPVSAASLPLPSGAATAANQSTANTSLATIATAVQAATPAGTNVIGHVIVDTAPTTAVTGTFFQSVQPVTQTPATSGGDSVYSVISSGAANQDAASIKSSAGQVYGYALFNTTSSARYVKLYNTGSPTSSSTPVFRVYLPPTGGANVSLPDGFPFGTAIGIRITTGAADNDVGACSANDVLANVWYK